MTSNDSHIRRSSTLSAALLALLTLLASCRSEELVGRPAAPGPPRTLVGENHDGTPFDLAQLETDYALVFFGFASCPDVCPITLGNLANAVQALPQASRDRVSVVFVTVDPQRDTPQRLRDYVGAFDESAFAVRQVAEQAAATAASFELVVEQQQPFDAARPDVYTVDHTASVFLVDDDARVVLSYPAYTEPALITGDLAQLLAP